MDSQYSGQYSTPEASPGKTRNSLKQHEQEIDSRVAALQARLHSARTHASPSQTPQSATSKRGFPAQQFSDAERSTNSGTPPEPRRTSAFATPQRQQSPYTQGYNLPATSTQQKRRSTRPSTVQKSSARPAAKKVGWFQWFRLGCPSRRNAATVANSQNHAFERQRLYAEEGRSTYGGIEGSPPSHQARNSITTPRQSREHGKLGAVTPRRLSSNTRTPSPMQNNTRF